MNTTTPIIESQKHLFALPHDLHYLNCAYKAPLLQSSELAGLSAVLADRDPSGKTPHDFFELPWKVREIFGGMVGCSADRVCIVPSASYGMASALNNIVCKPGQHALIVEEEFPSDYYSLDRWCRDHNAELRTLSGPVSDWTQLIIDSISTETAVLLTSSIHWMHGQTYDLEAIGAKCRETGTRLLVDGTQSVGAMKIDVNRYHIDALICASYKWLFGPYGMAVCYYGEAFDGGRPIEESWMNRTNARDFANLTHYTSDYLPASQRYNTGQHTHFIMMPMLHASMKQVAEWGTNSIQSYCSQLKAPLADYLASAGSPLSEEGAAHLFGVRLPQDCDTERLPDILKENKVSLSIRGEYLRISLHLYNEAKDIQQLIECIESTR